MNTKRVWLFAILVSFSVLAAAADALYLREEVIAPPGRPEKAFMGTPGENTVNALRDAGIFSTVPAIIPASVIQQYAPAGTPVIGGSVLYIPIGIVPAEMTEQLLDLMKRMVEAGNGRRVIVEIPNWRQMLESSGQGRRTGEDRELSGRIVRGGDIVIIRARSGAMAIEIQGRAQRSGEYGDIIPVLVTSTRKRLQCRITGPAEVSLEL